MRELKKGPQRVRAKFTEHYKEPFADRAEQGPTEIGRELHTDRVIEKRTKSIRNATATAEERLTKLDPIRPNFIELDKKNSKSLHNLRTLNKFSQIQCFFIEFDCTKLNSIQIIEIQFNLMKFLQIHSNSIR